LRVSAGAGNQPLTNIGDEAGWVLESGGGRAMEAIEALVLGASGALTVFSFSRPSSSARVIFLALFLSAATLAAMVPSLNQVHAQVTNAS
jgi:hypothetical protein